MGHATFEATGGNFQEQVLDSALPVLVDFTAEWCPPCKMLAPIVDQIAQKYEGKMRVAKLDTDLHPELSQQYGVMGLPTLILFQNGEPVKRMVGFTSRERIENQLTAYLQSEGV